MTNPDARSDAEPVPHRSKPLDHLQQRLRSPDRVVALSDGVFAIIITILVLEITVPPNLSTDSLHGVLEELRPTLEAWVVSFLSDRADGSSPSNDGSSAARQVTAHMAGSTSRPMRSPTDAGTPG